MVGFYLRLAAAGLACFTLAGCVSSSDFDDDGLAPSDSYSSARNGVPRRGSNGSVLQCVPYAREHSGVAIYGDAYTWWDKAAGRFERTYSPSEGAVMVLYNYAGPARGHVAVVREVIDSRTIKIDHANWLDDGAIFVDDPVRDVSPGNDWSMVRVFNMRTKAWGGRLYPVQGFIGPGRGTDEMLLARGYQGSGQSSAGSSLALNDADSGGTTGGGRDPIVSLLEAQDAE